MNQNLRQRAASFPYKSVYCWKQTYSVTMEEEIEMDVYDLVFDHQYHGRNIKIEDGGRAAQKMKK